METTRQVLLAITYGSLLSGRQLTDCVSFDDDTCRGGVAAASAYLRYNSRHTSNHTTSTTESDTTRPTTGSSITSLLVPWLDATSPFVQMHPLEWGVNKLVLHDLLECPFFLGWPFLLTEEDINEHRDTSSSLFLLQNDTFPFLLTNTYVPPSNSWYAYQQAVHLDATTNLAILSIADSEAPLGWPQIQAAQGMLDYVARLNQRNTDQQPDWIPVIYYRDVRTKLQEFLTAILHHSHPPALIVDLEGSLQESYPRPQQVFKTWLVSVSMDDDLYLQHELSISQNGMVLKVSQTTHDLDIALNDTAVRDGRYQQDIAYLHSLATAAVQNDPIVGQSEAMPPARIETRHQTLRACKAGECPIGNLFTDAFRWKTNADIAFVTSGGFYGDGWDEGDVRISDIWEAMPFSNNECTGVLSGISLFQLLDYSIQVATFEGVDTENGGKLLQTSGLRVVYNTEWEGSRIVSIHVLNQTTNTYLPIERLKLYTFATDSFLCGVYDQFPSLLTDLKVEGEVPGRIGNLLEQQIVADYLSSLDAPYNTTVQGRYQNNTLATQWLSLTQTKDTCEPGTYWEERHQTCHACPAQDFVRFEEEELQYESQLGSTTEPDRIVGWATILNTGDIQVAVIPKSSPNWIVVAPVASSNATGVESRVLQPGERLSVSFTLNLASLEAGTALGTVTFGVLDGSNDQFCTDQDVNFNIYVRVAPMEQFNQLTAIWIAGMALGGIAVLCSIGFALWTYVHREIRAVKGMQPAFLLVICAGVMLMALSVFPLSIDEGIASKEVCDIACMAVPWLLAVGFTVAMSALFVKLLRINKLFHIGGLRRVQIRAQDVIPPFLVLFASNCLLLSIWSAVDPHRWELSAIDGESWNTYGSCKPSTWVGNAMMIVVLCLNLGSLLLAAYQAYKARDISEEYSESKQLGIVIFSWIQMLFVGIPVLFLIQEEDATAKYFVKLALIIAMCLSLLLLIFVPLILHQREDRSVADRTSSRLNSGRFGSGSILISGLNPQGSAVSTPSGAFSADFCLGLNDIDDLNDTPEEKASQKQTTEFNI